MTCCLRVHKRRWPSTTHARATTNAFVADRRLSTKLSCLYGVVLCCTLGRLDHRSAIQPFLLIKYFRKLVLDYQKLWGGFYLGFFLKTPPGVIDLSPPEQKYFFWRGFILFLNLLNCFFPTTTVINFINLQNNLTTTTY